jgi:hypothetical protein
MFASASQEIRCALIVSSRMSVIVSSRMSVAALCNATGYLVERLACPLTGCF